MARKSVDITMPPDSGRDAGRTYRVTEAPASQAEEWAERAFLALARSGVSIPDDIATMGFAGIAMLGMNGLRGVSWHEAKPLLDEMSGCIAYVPDPSRPGMIMPMSDANTEEVATRLKLRKAVMELHVDFSDAVGSSTSTLAPTASATPNT